MFCFTREELFNSTSFFIKYCLHILTKLLNFSIWTGKRVDEISFFKQVSWDSKVIIIFIIWYGLQLWPWVDRGLCYSIKMPTTFAKATLKLEILKQERKFCTPKGRKYLLLIFMYIFLGITNPYTYLLHSKQIPFKNFSATSASNPGLLEWK